MKPTLHVIGLPHAIPTDDYSWCAYTNKNRRFVDMMQSLGYTVNAFWGYDMESEVPPFDANHILYKAMAKRVIRELKANSNKGDYLCSIAGHPHKPIADALPHLIAVEHGVGYSGIFTDKCCFESYCWMHAVYAEHYGGAYKADGRVFDTVIPNSYHVDEFPAGDGSGGYLLYVGRLIERKGFKIAIEVAKRLGMPLKVAGLGDTTPLKAYSGCEYLGVVKSKERAELMGGALCSFAPTQYVEPFGGVAVEAQLTGTPVISTDWGAFPETVEHGKTGFRCRLLSEFIEAVDKCRSLDRNYIRQRAIELYSTDTVKLKYDAWFQRLETLKGNGK